MASPVIEPPLWTLFQSLRCRAHPDDTLAQAIQVHGSFNPFYSSNSKLPVVDHQRFEDITEMLRTLLPKRSLIGRLYSSKQGWDLTC
jgi:hypothetical protein